MENQNTNGFDPNNITVNKIPGLPGNDKAQTLPSANPPSQSGQYIGQIENIVQPEGNSKKKGWLIAIIVGILILAIVIIIGVYSSDILERLQGKQNENLDLAVTSKMKAIMSDALIYANGNDNSFAGYSPSEKYQEMTFECSGEPIINISADGKFIVMFGKSCDQPSQYYCIDDRAAKYLSANTEMPELVQVDESVATSGAKGCPAVSN